MCPERYEIREATMYDEPWMRALAEHEDVSELFDSQWARWQLHRNRPRAIVHFLVVPCIGWICLNRGDHGNTLRHIVVRAESRRFGVGSQLFNHAATLGPLYTFVPEKETVANAFLAACGATPVGLTRPENGLVSLIVWQKG